MMSREELIELVEKIMKCEGTEEEVDDRHHFNCIVGGKPDAVSDRCSIQMHRQDKQRPGLESV